MGRDASAENSEQEELPHPPPEEVFSSSIDSMPKTKKR